MLSSASHIASSQVIFPEVRVFDGYLSTQTGTFVAARGISQLHLSYCVSFVYVFFFRARDFLAQFIHRIRFRAH
jgi:hypothetical protein